MTICGNIRRRIGLSDADSKVPRGLFAAAFVINTINFVHIATVIMRGNERWSGIVELAFITLTLIMTLVYAVLIVPTSPLVMRLGLTRPIEARFDVDATSWHGALNGKPVTYAWDKVLTLEDLGDRFVVTFATFGGRFEFSKESVSDPEALWTLCERMMTGGYNLVRRRDARLLVNTARHTSVA